MTDRYPSGVRSEFSVWLDVILAVKFRVLLYVVRLAMSSHRHDLTVRYNPAATRQATGWHVQTAIRP
jgi:hypothetical protein